MNHMKKAFCLLLTLALLLSSTLQFTNIQHAHAEEEAPLLRGTFQYAGMYNNQKDASMEYAYSDAYFDGDARVYNPSLSSMSLCLEMSSWSSRDEENWVDKTANSRELLTEIGFVDFAQNDFWDDAPTVDSIGAVAARKQLEDATLIALAVRGGGYFSEWGSNILIGAEAEHTGFATARDNVLTFLNEYITQCGITGRVKLWLVGFSRGAAVANMTAGYLNANGLTADASLLPTDLYCYTFEAPQGILSADAGADADYSNIHNIINPNDIVPLVAPADWGFGRYNQTSHLLPTITTTHYAKAHEEMLKHYADILETAEVLHPDKAAYNIAEYAKTLEMKVNWLSILPGGEPFIEINTVDNTHLPQSMMLIESVSALVKAAKSREKFHENIEADISRLLSVMLGANSGASLSDYIQTLGTTFTENDYANLVYVLEPIVQLNLKNFDARMKEVASHLREVIPQPEGYTDIVGTVSALVDVIATMLTEDPQAVLNLMLSFSNTNMIQAHYGEVVMAWLRTEDPNFTATPFTHEVPEALRIVRVNCPVNLLVYSSKGDLIASIEGDDCKIYQDGIGCAVNPDGEKVLYLPSDEEYVVRIIATGDGEVSCSFNEFNVVRGKHSYVVNFSNVPIKEGDALSAVLPRIPTDEYTDEPVTGSSADYRLLDQHYDRLTPDAVLRGDEITNFSVQVGRNNEFGQVLGGGTYVNNSFTQVSAHPISGSTFLGWFKDGVQVSGDTVYRFPVTENVSLTAHFSEAEKHRITFSASSGGTINNIDGEYTAGTLLKLSATPAEGYLLSVWSSSAGSIQQSGKNATTLTVPDCDAAVTVTFVPAGKICRSCKEVLPVGVNHQAPCMRIGHYTCKPGYYAYEHRPCNICGNDYDCIPGHGYKPGECGMYTCNGCGVEIRVTESHVAPCGTPNHFFCEAGYTADAHATCDHCGNVLCNVSVHGACSICNNGYICQGGHGYGSGECGVYPCSNCGVEIRVGTSHNASCGRHFTCDSNYNTQSHSRCGICGCGYYCEGWHGYNPGQCGYIPPTPKPTPKPTPTPSPVTPAPQPSESPSDVPSEEPSEQPSVEPSEAPSEQPSVEPSVEPSEQPSVEPSEAPSEQPSVEPSEEPSEQPSGQPSEDPSDDPSEEPSESSTTSESTDSSIGYAKRNTAAQLSYPLSGLAIASLAFLLPRKRRKED